jgi:hypothetical protein
MKGPAIIVLILTTSLLGQQLGKKTSAVSQAPTATMKLTPAEVKQRALKLLATHRPAPIKLSIAATPAKLKHQDVLMKLQKQKQMADSLRTTILASTGKKGPPSTQTSVARLGTGVAPNQDAVNSAPGGLPGAKSNPGIAAQSKVAPVTTTSATHPAPTTHVSSVSPLANPSVTAVAVCHGPTISTVDGQATGAWFSPDSQYNPATIQGCGFGDQQGSVHLYGPFATPVVNMTVEFWSDTAIIAAVDPNLSGEVDHLGNVTLVVAPASGPQVQAKGFNFYAARADVQLTTMPQSQANLQTILDAGGQNTVSVNFYAPSRFTNPGATAEVVRQDAGRFGSGTDSFTFSQLSPGFYVKQAMFWHNDLTQDECSALFGATTQMTMYTDGSWNAVWDDATNAIRVTTQERHCHSTLAGLSFNDTSSSDYAIAVWVNGPRGVDPWGGHR